MSRVIIALLCVFSLASWLAASPNMAEVKSFCVLVADYSKTSGGTEPTLSPDGKTLAFRADGSVWIAHSDAGVCKLAEWIGNRPKPWKLQFGSPEYKPYYSQSNNADRDMDWSPDGRQLVFVKDGYLCLAESFDFAKQTAAVRILAEPKHFPDEEQPSGVKLPKWSPDGKKIAILRCRRLKASVLSVLDVATGMETQLADDVWPLGATVWLQPWSPDSKNVAYTTGDMPKKGKARTDVAVVSTDGKARTKITEDGHSMSPSWSPRSDRLAFKSHYSFDLNGSEGAISPIYTADSTGANRKLACGSQMPSKEKLTAQEAEITSKTRQAFEDQYGDQLDFSQRAKLQQGKMTPDEMLDIAMLLAARKIGGDFLREFQRYLSAPEAAQPGILAAAMQMLTEEQRQAFTDPWVELLMDPFMTGLSAIGGLETCPVWSPDGRKIALIREQWSTSVHDLVIVDPASGQEETIFASWDVCNVSWSPDGKAVVVQSRRLMSRIEEGNSITTSPGYPEIWLLALD